MPLHRKVTEEYLRSRAEYITALLILEGHYCEKSGIPAGNVWIESLYRARKEVRRFTPTQIRNFCFASHQEYLEGVDAIHAAERRAAPTPNHEETAVVKYQPTVNCDVCIDNNSGVTL